VGVVQSLQDCGFSEGVSVRRAHTDAFQSDGEKFARYRSNVLHKGYENVAQDRSTVLSAIAMRRCGAAGSLTLNAPPDLSPPA
jgi:hypothetical protein